LKSDYLLKDTFKKKKNTNKPGNHQN